MGFFDDLKYRREVNKEYKTHVGLVKADIAISSKAEQQAKLKLDKLVELRDTGVVDEQYFRSWSATYVAELRTNPIAMDRVISEVRHDYVRWEQKRIKAEKELSFLRPNTKEDIAERKSAFADFAKDVLTIDPDGTLDLRFHSTTLATTKDIIESGGLISSVDRLDGFVETTNYSNEISVSEIRNIQYTINYWTDIEGYNGCRPCGCMFVLQPQSQEEAAMISGRQMHNVLFHEHPEQLIAIVTTSENVERVQTWLRENGLSEEVVCRFDELSAKLEAEKDGLVPEYRKIPEKEISGTTQFSSVDSLISGAQARCCTPALETTKSFSNERIMSF